MAETSAAVSELLKESGASTIFITQPPFNGSSLSTEPSKIKIHDQPYFEWDLRQRGSLVYCI